MNQPPEFSDTLAAVIDRTASSTVRAATVILTLLYAFFAVMHLVILPYPVAMILSGVAATSALAIAMTYRFLNDADRQDRSHGILATLSIIVIINITLHMALDPRPEHTLNFAAATVAVGFFVFRRAWYSSFLVTILAGWAITSQQVDEPLGDWGWFLLFAAVTSVIVHFQRRASARATAATEFELLRRARLLGELDRAEELSRGDTDAMLQRICAVSAEVLGTQRVGVWTFDEQRSAIRCEALFDQVDGDSTVGERLPREAAPRYFEALDLDPLIAARDTRRDPRTSELQTGYLDSHGITAMLDAPILIGGELAGVICHEHAGSTRSFSVEDQSWARSVADIVSMVLQTASRNALERRTRVLERLEGLGVLAGGVAHDFNNLLTVIQGHAELLRDNPHAERDAGVNAILTAVERAGALARQMLAYSGRSRATTETLRLSGLVRELHDDWAKELLLHASLDTSMLDDNVFVDVDRTQLRQVLANLVGNAAQAGARTISVSVMPTIVTDALPGGVIGSDVMPGQWARLVVRDDGCGMSDAEMAQVFDPFFTTRAEGTGLGLAAVLGIVRMHQGDVSVESKPGQGSTFVIWLPLAEATPESALPDPDDASAVVEPAGPRHARRVLVVDDEELVRRATSLMLRHAGFDIVTCSGYRDVAALDLEAAGLDAAVVDLTLKDGDGLDVTRVLHTFDPALPVLLVSGYDSENVLSRLEPGSITDFLQKPFSRDNLVARLEALATPGARRA